MSAGDDFMFRSFQDVGHLPEEMEAQCMPGREFSKPFPLMTGWTRVSDPPIHVEPQFRTVEEILGRWRHMDNPLTTSAFNSENLFVTPTTVGGTNSSGLMYQSSFELILMCFKFNSGHFCCKVALAPGVDTAGLCIGTDRILLNNNDDSADPLYPGCGLVMTKADTWGIMDFAVPYLSTYAVRLNPWDHYYQNSGMPGSPVYWRDQNETDTGSNAIAFAQRWKKAGPNFQLFFLMPPPSVWYMQWNYLADISSLSFDPEAFSGKARER